MTHRQLRQKISRNSQSNRDVKDRLDRTTESRDRSGQSELLHDGIKSDNFDVPRHPGDRNPCRHPMY